MNRLVANASQRRARFAGAETRSLAIAAIRATREGVIEEDGEKLDVIIGTPMAGEVRWTARPMTARRNRLVSR
jgi:uncharacterized protein